MNNFYGFLYTLLCVCTAMIGYTIHGSLFYSFLNFIFAPISIIYWLITHQITLAVIKVTFGFFF